MKRLYTPLIAFIFLVACKSKKEEANPQQKPAQPATIVDVLVAQPQTISNRIEANGSVVAMEYVDLHSEVIGRLTYLNVPEGSFVKQGTIIAKIYDEDLQAQLAKSKVLLDIAQKNEARLAKLLAINGVNQSDYDAALSAVDGYKADIAYTESLIAKTVIKAPFSGVVGLRQVSLGAFLLTTNIICSIQQIDKVKVDFTLPEEYSTYIKKGNTVDVLVSTPTENIQKATIIAIEPQVNQLTRNLKVRAILKGGKVNPGAFVKVYVSASGTEKKSILIPTNSIIPDDKNKQIVLVKDGKASFVNVKTGVRQSDFVEVLSGVNAGDSVVVTGVLFAKPKAALKVRSVKTLEQLKN